MKTAVIFLDYERHVHTEITLQSLVKSRYKFDMFNISEKGIARAINIGLEKTKEYDAVAICANDIVMPEGWLSRMVEYAQAIPESGMIGIHCVEQLTPVVLYNDSIPIHKTMTPFGNVLLTRKAIDAVGKFQEDYDPYGMQDSDYSYRLDKSGFINYWIPNMQSQHIGADMGDDTPYRRMKDEGLKASGEKWEFWTAWYDETKKYKI